MGCYRSAGELREILDSVISEIDADPEDGPRLRMVAAPLRIEVRDLKLVFNLAPDDGGQHCVVWDFSRRSHSTPKLMLAMNSDFANRFLQGRENPAIAIARGKLSTTVSDPGTALRFFPATKPLFAHYRDLVKERYPHLALD
jgi:hypothetical protein